MNQNPKNGGVGGTIALIGVVLIFIVLAFSSCGGGGGSSSSHHSTITCKSCGRTYEAGDSGGNYMNIARTGMCKNCYNNFKWAQDALGK